MNTLTKSLAAFFITLFAFALPLLAQSSDMTESASIPELQMHAEAPSPVGIIIGLLLSIFGIVCLWKIYTKAGQPGWAAIIPFYNIFVLLKIVGRPVWWFFLLLIPFVNFIIIFIVIFDLAKSFGKQWVYGLGLLFLPIIFYPMLAFGSSQYTGPSAGQQPAF